MSNKMLQDLKLLERYARDKDYYPLEYI